MSASLVLTAEQARALEWIASFGIEEKAYCLNQYNNYTDEELATQYIDLEGANDVISLLQGFIRDNVKGEKS